MSTQPDQQSIKSDLSTVLEEVEARVRIAERQGWANRSVPVRLLRQIAEELRLRASVHATRSGFKCHDGLPHYCPNCDRTFSEGNHS